jgi:predicted RNA methylase
MKNGAEHRNTSSEAPTAGGAEGLESGPDRFAAVLQNAFRQGRKLTIVQLRKFAAEAGIATANEKYLWELTELAWTRWYRRLAQDPAAPRERYDSIVDFYRRVQPSYTGVDSHKKVFQQYSTSAPIAWLAGWFTDGGGVSGVLEPSAGNGLLTIYYPERLVTVNDLDPVRYEHLRSQPFRRVDNRDASVPFPPAFQRAFDAVLTNPPFGSLPDVNRDFGFPFKALDHVMVAHALACLRDGGRAALLIGGHTEFNPGGYIATHRPFFNWLYRHYRVAAMLNIDSAKLYHKQGTDFPLRLILIGGRKQEPHGSAPTLREAPALADVVASFEDLFDRVEAARAAAGIPEVTLTQKLQRELFKLQIETV